MSIVDELNAAAEKTQPSCIEAVVKAHGEENRHDIELAFNHTASSRDTERILASHGIRTSSKTILRHRKQLPKDKGGCGCWDA